MEFKSLTKITPIPHIFNGVCWEWHGLEVKKSVQSEHAGSGVFATVGLPKKACLPYYGMVITEEQYQELKKLGRAQYIMAFKNGRYLNADPAVSSCVWTNGVGERNLWIAALVNEPTKGPPNMKLTFYRDEQPRFVALRDITAGEELTARYGSFYTRLYKVYRASSKE